MTTDTLDRVEGDGSYDGLGISSVTDLCIHSPHDRAQAHAASIHPMVTRAENPKTEAFHILAKYFLVAFFQGFNFSIVENCFFPQRKPHRFKTG